jgi:hypothetical protein
LPATSWRQRPRTWPAVFYFIFHFHKAVFCLCHLAGRLAWLPNRLFRFHFTLNHAKRWEWWKDLKKKVNALRYII